MSDRISACITAGNEEEGIRRCLESVTWCDEIIVVDSFSEDRTVEISREYTSLVYEHRWLGYIGQKNLIKDLATGDWILFIDADEEVSPGLRDEILKEFRSGRSADYAGYRFPRLVRYLNTWIRHGDWYPDLKLRLFRKSKGRCGGREPHDRIEVDGPVKRMQHPLFHYTYAGIEDQVTQLNKFSSITVAGQYEDGRRFRLIDLVTRPMLRFLRGYVLKAGFRDGLPGFIVAVNNAYTVFIKYAKLWEKYLGPDARFACECEKAGRPECSAAPRRDTDSRASARL